MLHLYICQVGPNYRVVQVHKLFLILAHKKSRRYTDRSTSVAITSRPEKIAKAHTRAVMKALHEGYY